GGEGGGPAVGGPLATQPATVLAGDVRQTAERLHAYWGAGAGHAVLAFADGDWRAQVDLLAEVRALLD
ncbi:hypothetical protein AAHZ94_35280, partial [Streptomyces sp. HSW2009]|uniref:hypothetical protein n=1 Tax=Streptomyces sp. HSW2009 TaxID=3142890 RepID=UPI0032ED5E03